MLHKYQSFSVGSETRRATAPSPSRPPDSFRLCSFEIIKQNREDINLSRIGGGAVFFARCLIHFQSDLYGRRASGQNGGGTMRERGREGGSSRRRESAAPPPPPNDETESGWSINYIRRRQINHYHDRRKECETKSDRRLDKRARLRQ